MESILPYRVHTATGERVDIAFPFHPETVSPSRVAQILSAVLNALYSKVRLDPATSNGDMLQAVAMALAVRATMIDTPREVTDSLSADLVNAALAATRDVERTLGPVGHA
jgi:predicted metalloenzyme YecM